MAKKRRKSKLTARTADRHLLYTESVQSTEGEIDFFSKVYKKENKRLPRVVREDFCGTAAISCDWVAKGPENLAIGVDLDPDPLAYGREHYVSKLTDDQKKRLTLLQDDVLTVTTKKVDVIAALNFSFCVFKKRAVLMRYLKRCRQAIKPGGIMIMDIYGGPESIKTSQEKTSHGKFTYVWDQAKVNPITNEVVNHIHFLFPGGSAMKKAFTYDWRLWTPAELTEALEEAGFRETRVYWEGSTDEGEGDGIFRPRKSAEPEDAWVAYIVGLR